MIEMGAWELIGVLFSVFVMGLGFGFMLGGGR